MQRRTDGKSARAAAARPGRRRDAGLASRRRAQILERAVGHFARSGYAGADLDALAADVGCAKGTLYRYFPSKEHLFHAAVDFVMQGLLQATSPDGGTDGLDRLLGAVRAYLAYFEDHPEYVELLMLERAEFRDRKRPTYFEHREANRKRWRKTLEGLMKEGRLRRMPADRVLDVIGNVLYGTIFTDYFQERRGSLDARVETIRDVVFRGLLPAEER